MPQALLRNVKALPYALAMAIRQSCVAAQAQLLNKQKMMPIQFERHAPAGQSDHVEVLMAPSSIMKGISAASHGARPRHRA